MLKLSSVSGSLPHAFLAVMIGVLSVPVATTALFQSIDNDTAPANTMSVTDLRQDALEDAVRVRTMRRRYWRAVEIYNEMVRGGMTNLVAPDINDPISVDWYLRYAAGEELPALPTRAAAPEEASVSMENGELVFELLPERDQDLIEGYVNTGRCSVTLKTHEPAYGEAFYELCLAILDARIAVQNKTVVDRAAQLRSLQRVQHNQMDVLRQRLRVLEESLTVDGAAVRPRTHDGRPRLPDAQ